MPGGSRDVWFEITTFDPSNAATRAIVDSEWSFVLVRAYKLHLQFLLAQGPDFESLKPIITRISLDSL